LVATATSLDGWKNNFRSFIYSQSTTIPVNFIKISVVDVEIIGLTETTKNKYFENVVKHQQNISPLRMHFAGGRVN